MPALLRGPSPPPPVPQPAAPDPLLTAVRARVEALLALPDPPPGARGALDAVLAVAERFAAAGDRAMLEDLVGHVEEMPARWEGERRRREVRLSRLLTGRAGIAEAAEQSGAN